jgi:hypothetical protein
MPASKDREERLARALRENLKRRKARGRPLARGAAPAHPEAEEKAAEAPTDGRNPAQNEH